MSKFTVIKQALGRTIGVVLLTSLAHADSGTWVGNGDDGSDLEGAAPTQSEKLIAARAHALELLRKLHVEGIPGLGILLPETERSPLYMSKIDSAAKLGSDQGSFHTDMKGRVFARTLAEPHAPTRFFPVAERLDDDQLVALHIHEALHRALPVSVRENEAVVSELALAIVSPESSYDQVRKAADKLIPLEDRGLTMSVPTSGDSGNSSLAYSPPPPASSLAANPSFVGYEFRNYTNNPELSSRTSVNQMHLLRSFLYPFGSTHDAFGFGIEAALIKQPALTVMGPLGLSARLRLWSGRGFDVAAWGNYSLNMLSAEELKNSPFGRDVGTFGIEVRKDLKFLYVENYLSYSLPGSASATIGRVRYEYGYGGVFDATVHVGGTLGFLKLGGFVQIDLADYYQVHSVAFPLFDTGRYRLISAGPELTARFGDIALSAYGKFLINAPEDIEFDALGNLMGAGSGQASIGARFNVYF